LESKKQEHEREYSEWPTNAHCNALYVRPVVKQPITRKRR
jgi:hypothetical protein